MRKTNLFLIVSSLSKFVTVYQLFSVRDAQKRSWKWFCDALYFDEMRVKKFLLIAQLVTQYVVDLEGLSADRLIEDARSM